MSGGISMNERQRKRCSTLPAFTIIELLVVVAIIALLLAILLPSLASARAEARAVTCATNLAHVGKAVLLYASRERVFPVAYAYLDRDGGVDVSPETQERIGGPPPPWGYVHWSYFLYSDGKVDKKAFMCPSFENGGAPRTNPGPEPGDWEAGQVDDKSQSSPNSSVDKQAPRMAYTANAAIMPRNKFTSTLSGGGRVNRLVNESAVKNAGRTILAAEFYNDWRAVAEPKSGNAVLLSKSHRPVNPFYHISTGSDEYKAPPSSSRSGFYLGIPNVENFGLMTLTQVRSNPVGLIESSLGEINSLGRNHPGGDEKFGGTSNFLYTDGHVERKTVLETLKRFEWGERYYSLSGNNVILREGDSNRGR